MRVCSGWRRFLILLPLLFFLSHLFYVLELHQKVEDQPKKKQSKKSDHLVLGPVAGQGFPNRLQCQGPRALNKTHVQTSPSTEDGVSFVTVFTIYNSSAGGSQSSDVVTVGSASYTKTERSLAILNVFINFIQVTMPRSNVVILTDPASDLSIPRDHVTVYPVKGDYSREKLMLQRIRSYIDFLDIKLKEITENPGRSINHYIFTDSDMAVVDDLGTMFHDYPSFHLALTFRNNKGQPLNSGFVAVRGTHAGILRSKMFLEKVLEVYSSKYMTASRMLGDQLALAEVVRSHLAAFDTRGFRAFEENIDGASVLFLPCATHNWTPPEGAGQFHGMPLDVKVVHFKGSRKRLMLEAWNFYNSSNAVGISDMLCLVLMSGRTKYDF